MNPPPKNILLILPRQLGDILLATTLPQVLKAHFPGVRVSWSAHPMGRQILLGNPHLDAILLHPVAPRMPVGADGSMTFAKRASHFCSYFKYLWDELRFVRRLRLEKFDVVIDAMNNPRTALQAFFSSAPLRISFRTRAPRNWAFHVLIPREDLGQCYLAKGRLGLLEPLGLVLANVAAEMAHATFLPVAHVDMFRARAVYEEACVASGCPRLIVLSPTHRHEVRKWPESCYVELALRLVRASSDAVLWIFGPGEESGVRQLHERLQTLLRQAGLSAERSQMAPLLSLREVGSLCAMARGWVGNSNGLSHVAVAGGARTVQIHGPTRPATWTHPDKLRHRGIQRHTGCLECGKNSCRLPVRECLDLLSVDDVFEQTWDLLYASEHCPQKSV